MVNKNALQEDRHDLSCEERAVYYLLLSRLFTDQSIGTDIAGYLEILQPLVVENCEIALGFSQKLEEWQNKDQLDHLLKTEYARLFILAGGVRPYESVYRGESKLLMQEPWVKVKQFYHKHGLKLENPAFHPEDHASAEFSFMYYLLQNDDLETADIFFNQHLNCWIPIMLDDILNYPYADFYKDVARFGQMLFEKEQEYLQQSNQAVTSVSDQFQGSDN